MRLVNWRTKLDNTDLKKAGLKVTLPRVKILQILENAKDHHLSAEDVYRVLLESGDDIGLELNMQKFLIGFAILLLTTGCVRKMTIEQGNIMTPDMTSKIHKGMTPAEVKHIMGTPVVLNTFRENRIDYVYTLKQKADPMTEKRLTLIFEDGKLKDMIENTY